MLVTYEKPTMFQGLFPVLFQREKLNVICITIELNAYIKIFTWLSVAVWHWKLHLLLTVAITT